MLSQKALLKSLSPSFFVFFLLFFFISIKNTVLCFATSLAVVRLAGMPTVILRDHWGRCHWEGSWKAGFLERWYWTWAHSLWGCHDAGRGEFETLELTPSWHTDNQCSLGPLVGLAGSGRSCFSVQEAKSRMHFKKVCWASGFYSKMECQNYQKIEIFPLLGFSSSLQSAPSVPVPLSGDVTFPTLGSVLPFHLSVFCTGSNMCELRWREARRLSVEGTKRVRHMMEA